MSCIDATRSLAPISELLRRIPAWGTFLAIVAAFLPLSLARAQTFSNSAPITIPQFGPASAYPSTINVTGRLGPTEGIRVTLQGFAHTYPNDIVVLLVAPTGQKILLMGRVGGDVPVSNVNATFASGSVTPVPSPIVSGTYAPTGTTPSLPAPAPAAPYSSNLSDLAGLPSNGVWQLYIEDRAAGDAGTLASGWSIQFVDAPAPAISPNTFTYQGRLSGADSAADFKFTLWDHPFATTLEHRIAAPITRDNVGLTDGLFAVDLDFEMPIPTGAGAFLQIEVASPPGSGFVTLSPRQVILPAPVAGTLTPVTTLPSVAEIRGPQGEGEAGVLTLRAPGADGVGGAGSRGGTLRLIAGDAYSSAPSQPPTGTSLDNNVHIIAGDNKYAASFGDAFNGNIQFFAGNGQPERMRLVGDSGALGIGTTEPRGLLDVRGNIVFGPFGDVTAVGGHENLRMLRGTFAADGSTINGAGFAVSRAGVGIYTIVFSTPFANSPAVTANVFNTLPLVINVSAQGANSAVIQVRNFSGALTDSAVNFIAIGPR